ncbi:MAG: S41 family peptidase [Sphingomicrobium sp.]
MLLLTGATALIAASPGLAQAPQWDEVVKTLATLIERDYPDAAMAKAVGQSLRSNLRRGKYSRIKPEELASLLTSDLKSLTHDEHLKVSYDPADAKLRSPALSPLATEPYKTPKSPSAKARAIFGQQGYGVVKTELLEGNVGLLRIDNFVPLYDIVRTRLASAMELLSDSHAMVLDLRQNGGGTSDTPAYLMSYFFDREPFVLNRMAWRNLPDDVVKTTREIIGPSYGEERPLVVATSSRTFSAAEAVAYSLQSTKRATIVGQRTRGGANPGDFFSIGGGFVAFTPQGRAVDAVTGKSWEGVGVSPDVSSLPPDILKTAHQVAVRQALARASDPEIIEVLNKALKSGPYLINE